MNTKQLLYQTLNKSLCSAFSARGYYRKVLQTLDAL